MSEVDEKSTLEITVPKLYKDLSPELKEKMTEALYGTKNRPEYIEKFSEKHPALSTSDVIDCINICKSIQTDLRYIERFIEEGYNVVGARTLIELAREYSSEITFTRAQYNNDMPGKRPVLKYILSADNILFLSELTYASEGGHKVPQEKLIEKLISEIDEAMYETDLLDMGIPQIICELEEFYESDSKNFIFQDALQRITNKINTEYFDDDTLDQRLG